MNTTKSHVQNNKAIISVLLGAIIVTLDISLTNTALPAITKVLGTGAAQTIWIVKIYYIAVIAALLPLASLGEIIGHRRVFLLGLTVYSVGSLASGLAPSLDWLMAGRVFLGIGSAAVAATTPALIKTLYPPDKLGRGLGLYATVVAISLTLGPTLASLILSVANWNWLYLPNSVIGLVLLIMAFIGVPDTEKNVRAFDAWAAFLCASMFALLLIAISGMAHMSWQYFSFLFFSACLLGWILLKREQGKSAPIFAIDLFRIRMFTLSSITSVCAFGVQGLIFVVLPFFFIDRLGFTQIEAGYLISPFAATLGFMGVVAGGLIERFKPGVLGFVGLIVLAIGLVLLLTLSNSPSLIDIVWRLMVCGVGYGMFQSPNMVAMMNSAPRNRSGSAGGILATSRLIGQAIGATSVAFCFSAFGENAIEYAFYIAVLMALCGAISSLLRLTQFALR